MLIGISRPIIASMVIKRICPPSKIGRGIRFMIARLMLIIARKIRRKIIPRLAISTLNLMINTGPPAPLMLLCLIMFFRTNNV